MGLYSRWLAVQAMASLSRAGLDSIQILPLQQMVNSLELIKKLWNVAWDLWVHRNSILHNSLIAHEEIVESSVNQQIWAIYEARPQALPQNSLHLL